MMSRRRFLGSAALAGLLASAGLTLRGGKADAAEDAFEIVKSDAEWKALLTPEQYYVLRQHGTERPRSSPLDREKRMGMYHCAGCDLPLFTSHMKYDSRTGWPSFWDVIPDTVGTREDRNFFMVRTEVHCRRCGGHLGHVFEDGPPPTGLRYCMNGVALTFKAHGPA